MFARAFCMTKEIFPNIKSHGPIEVLGLAGLGLMIHGHRRYLNAAIRKGLASGRISVYIGSCPDYSHVDGKYTHQSLGAGVPLLTERHLSNDTKFLNKLGSKMRINAKIMIADVEATDEVFCNKFTKGNETEFLRRCDLSKLATRKLMYQKRMCDGKSTTFFEEFGREKFLETQNAYLLILMEKYRVDSVFKNKTDGNIIKRMTMYKKMYPDNITDQDFLVYRTLRTMAQYLTLGRMISEESQPSLMIVHPTTNIRTINQRNVIRLPQDDKNKFQKIVPLLIMPERIY